MRDSGSGIAAEVLPRIFDLFFQAGRSLTQTKGGLGIGLTLVKSLVEMHGGSVRATSEGPGRGSEFIVWLPLTPARAVSGVTPSGSAAPGVAQRRRILVVDDNVDAAESVAMLLQLHRHEVRVAHDGPAALETARDYRPDVVLLDIGMPVMSGYEVAQELRRQPDFADTLVIAMTGWGQEEDRRRSREAGFDHHLIKPVDPDDLQRLLVSSPDRQSSRGCISSR